MAAVMSFLKMCSHNTPSKLPQCDWPLQLQQYTIWANVFHVDYNQETGGHTLAVFSKVTTDLHSTVNFQLFCNM